MKNLRASRLAAGIFMLTIPGILLAGVGAGAWSFSGSGRVSSCSRPVTAAPESLLGEHYSPEENLEAIDVALIDQAQKTLEIAMYAFTDRPIADAVIRASSRGVAVWIYRDGIQVKDRGDKTRRIRARLPSGSRVEVRVKHNSSRNIMHLKAYLVDGKYLRTGSANWSPPGEGAWCSHGRRPHRDQQDNNLFITENPREIQRFETLFRRIYERQSNREWKSGETVR